MNDKTRSDWAHGLQHCIGRLTSLADASCSLRVTLREDKLIELVLTSTFHDKSGLNNYFAGFERLNALIDGSTFLPQSREEHDAIWGNFPLLRCRGTAPSFKLGDIWFACDFRIGPFLDELLLEIEPFNCRFSYQVNVCKIAIDPRWIADARKNALKIGGIPGVASDALKMQEDLAHGLVNANAVVEEYLGVENSEASAVIMESLKRRFDLQYSRLRFEIPHFEFSQNSYEDSLLLGIHSGLIEGLNIDDVCTSAIDHSTSIELLSWSPSNRLSDRLETNRAKFNREELVELNAEAMSSFDVFFSYNAKDKPIVRRLAAALRSRGLKVWLDEWELVPGRPWQNALEEIIQTAKSAAVLVGKDGLGPWEVPEMRACLDQFVKRQLPVIPVLLPDTRNKPDLPIFLRQFTWVDLRSGLTSEGLNQMQWGITGVKPKP
ncbi:MAG: toll/interleukin-1 receptor domain-containing protein [Gammaproteobacteria bacterium]